jgi:hypothetical protein
MTFRRLHGAGRRDRVAEAAWYVPLAMLRSAWWRTTRQPAGWGVLNGQEGRRVAVDQLIRRFRPTSILETGTFFGTTTAYFAGSRLPVYTVELNGEYAAVARRQLRRFENVTLLLGDSVAAIKTLIAEQALARPFVYLDAHWGATLPLATEVETLLSESIDAIVCIDDFRVPDDDGYGFDSYRGHPLDLGLLTLTQETIAAYPAVRSEQETGSRRGAVYLGHGQEGRAVIDQIATEGLLRLAR